jgi:UrcA family protein
MIQKIFYRSIEESMTRPFAAKSLPFRPSMIPTACQFRTFLETIMNTNVAVVTAKAFICIPALTACAALSGPVQADGPVVAVKIPVSYSGLDLTQPTGAQELYRRLHEAAFIACTHGNRVDLQPLADPAACYEKAIGDAVRSVKQPQLTVIYLKTHTLHEAATHGIEIPDLVAAK